ncbi:MAG: class I SAM-dependent methyltransferase [Alphaproteobacteria bacterium]|nr:class I SAM-dependent methyltransferase [Alphaproteobacteria bacterium]MCD8519783.1 class I SAM-dependent methyltransferase [Alphaproteobacteria bacterium]MCD8570342.1 class I SAM-dependent methyltransferase [Alphaproteobacteria bacterium]
MSDDRFRSLLSPEVQAFIRAHEGDDIAALALKKPPEPDWPYRDMLEQIKSRRKAADKLAAWLDIPGFLFPAPDTVEQASSLATARYKAGLVKAHRFTDLTGGSGADSWICAEKGASGIVIERNPESAALLAHNFKLTHPGRVKVMTGNAEDILPTLPRTDLILIDPQRREGSKRGIFRLADGSPHILELLPALRDKTRYVLLKTAPLLDITQTLEVLPCVREVHVLERSGECKEVLYLIDFESDEAAPPVITAASLAEDGTNLHTISFTTAEEENAPLTTVAPADYLFEPGPAFMKAGCFKLMAARYGLAKLAHHTHLYTGASPCPDFPGRSFKIAQILQARKDAVKEVLPALKANLSIRNFPASVEDLRKKLSLKDGGDDYLFACTLENGEKTLIHARKF